MPHGPGQLLRLCHGYRVDAEDGAAGVVQTPLFAPDCDEPDYLLVRTDADLGARRALVAVALVSGVHPDSMVVSLAGPRAALALLPETLPLVAHGLLYPGAETGAPA